MVGAKFLLIDHTEDGKDNRLLGFGTHDLITTLCGTDTIYMDGTFRVVPAQFAQLYTLHGFFRGEMIPFLYFLLPDKEKLTYARMFRLIQDYAISLGLVFSP